MHLLNYLYPTHIFALGFSTALLGSILHFYPLATLGFITWLFGCVSILAQTVFRQVQQRDLRIFLAGVTTFSCLTLTALIIYFTIGVTTNSAFLGLLVLTLTLYLLGKNAGTITLPQASLDTFAALSGNQRIILAITLFSQIITLLLLVLGRFDGALITPWMIFPSSIFLFFFIGTAGVITLQSQTNTTWLWLACTQTFLAVTVSCFVYGIGFGFDPFIHRAAETALVNDGFIYPQRFLYSGQYALIGSLHFLTRLPINLIDIWILPLLASVFLPWSAYLGLRDGWKLPEPAARFGWAIALFIPFMLFTFTVPFSFTYVIYCGVLFLAPLARTKVPGIALIVFAGISCLFHPLLGVPTLILLLAHTIYFKQEKTSYKAAVLTCFFVVNAIALPLLLALYQHNTGVRIDPMSLFTNIQGFITLFANPFRGYSPLVKWTYHLIYWHRYWQPVIGIIVAFLAAVVLRRRCLPAIPWLVFILSTFVTIYLTSTLFVYKDIIAHEQHEFALRLLQSLYLGAAPILALLILPIVKRYIVTVPVLAAIVTLSWYFSYPQYNAKAAMYSPSVSRSDIDAVRAIDHMSNGRPYITLSNQMTSAAALQEFGFAHYYDLEGESVLWYPIPTGGALYASYLSLIYTNGTGAIQELFSIIEVDYIFVVFHTYWPWSPELLEELKVQCQGYYLIRNDVHLFRCDRYVTHEN